MNKTILVLGDVLAIALVTFIGFATHGETGLSFLPRMAAAFFPLILSWFLAAPWLGLFEPNITSNLKQIWRPALAMLLAVPLAVVLRGLILNAAALPIFAVVMWSVSAFGMIVWRALYWLFGRNKQAPPSAPMIK
jgi:hypothetical protein